MIIQELMHNVIAVITQLQRDLTNTPRSLTRTAAQIMACPTPPEYGHIIRKKSKQSIIED